jgi:hypothetical protein
MLLCDLRDLCAMLSAMRVFPAQKQAVHQRAFRSRTLMLLCDLHDLCAMLSAIRVFPAQKQAVHQKPSALQTQSPSVTSLLL